MSVLFYYVVYDLKSLQSEVALFFDTSSRVMGFVSLKDNAGLLKKLFQFFTVPINFILSDSIKPIF